jgi:hypothetical protein
MPYPESCPECGGAFRNSGTHYTSRRNEVGRHILLELGCQNTRRRYWWDFTAGNAAEDGTSPAREANTIGAVAAVNGTHANASNGTGGINRSNGSAPVATLERTEPLEARVAAVEAVSRLVFESESQLEAGDSEVQTPPMPMLAEIPAHPAKVPPTMKDAFIRQLQLDRLTLRQMRSWLMSDESRRAIEVAAGATEATYERLALILFGVDLPQLLGKQPAVPASTGMSAEERLELQREKARIRARLRRAAAKAARQQA